MNFNICFKRLLIFSIATLMCLSIIAFIPTSAISDTYENSDLYMPLLPDMKGVITSNQANIYQMGLSNALVAGADYIVHAQADITEDNAGNGDPDNLPAFDQYVYFFLQWIDLWFVSQGDLIDNRQEIFWL